MLLQSEVAAPNWVAQRKKNPKNSYVKAGKSIHILHFSKSADSTPLIKQKWESSGCEI